MNPALKALRAITGVYFQRILLIASGVAAVVFAVLFIVVNYLAMNFSPWWWIFMIVLVPITVMAVIVSAGLWFASRKLMPRTITKDEKKIITTFGSKLFGIIERSRMPYPLMLAMVAKDVLRGRSSNLVRETIQDSTTLKSDFERIRTMFRDNV